MLLEDLDPLSSIPNPWTHLINRHKRTPSSFINIPDDVQPLSTTTINDLPHDTVTDILLRVILEGDRVYGTSICRLVCKEWLLLARAPEFLNFYHEAPSSIQLLLAQCILSESTPGRLRADLFLVREPLFDKDDGDTDPIIKKVYLRSSPKLKFNNFHKLFCSCDGLLLFQRCREVLVSTVYICNPSTHEEIYLYAPVDGGFICGFFFHPSSKEYRILHVRKLPVGAYEYLICSLQTRSWRRLENFYCCPVFQVSPVALNGFLFWTVETSQCGESIMMFSMEDEKFLVVGHPRQGRRCELRNKKHIGMHLLEMEGRLVLCCFDGKMIHVLVLEDQMNWIWVKKYEVNLQWRSVNERTELWHLADPFKRPVRIISIENYDYENRKKKRRTNSSCLLNLDGFAADPLPITNAAHLNEEVLFREVVHSHYVCELKVPSDVPMLGFAKNLELRAVAPPTVKFSPLEDISAPLLSTNWGATYGRVKGLG
ncbi:hypothetical protein Ancab_005394 [Ancistrocladus abbreviatus]